MISEKLLSDMKIQEIREGKDHFMPLLLLGDEQESMIWRYLERGRMAVLFCGKKAVAVSVVTKEADRLWELKNIAVLPCWQRQGCGRRLLEFWLNCLRGQGTLQAGTGETPKTMGFYIACGFQFSHRIQDFFVHYYDHPIVEDGKLLKDMVYFSRKL